MQSFWDRVRDAVGYKTSEEKQAEIMTGVLARKRESIREEWVADAVKVGGATPALYEKYDKQIEAYNRVAFEIHDRYNAGEIQVKRLPEPIHPEGMQERVRAVVQYELGKSKKAERSAEMSVSL